MKSFINLKSDFPIFVNHVMGSAESELLQVFEHKNFYLVLSRDIEIETFHITRFNKPTEIEYDEMDLMDPIISFSEYNFEKFIGTSDGSESVDSAHDLAIFKFIKEIDGWL